jgi:hypothetical protein
MKIEERKIIALSTAIAYFAIAITVAAVCHILFVDISNPNGAWMLVPAILAGAYGVYIFFVAKALRKFIYGRR